MAFLDEAVKQNHVVLPNGEYDPCDFARQYQPYFPRVGIEFADMWQPDRPAELDHLYVFTDLLLVAYGHILEPLPDGLVARRCPEENHKDSLVGLYF